MSKAKHALITSAKPTPTRRALFGGAAAVAAIAALPLEALAAMPGNVASDTSNKALDDLAEARRLIAAMIANDKGISAAEEARDKRRARALEKEYRALYREFTAFADRVHNEPPGTWLDIVIRAEFAGYMIAWDKPRSDWETLLEQAEDDSSAGYPGMSELVMAVLYLASQQNGATSGPPLA